MVRIYQNFSSKASRPRWVSLRNFPLPAGFKTLARNRGKWSLNLQWYPPWNRTESRRSNTNRLRSSYVEQNESLQNFFNWTRNWRTNPVKNCVIAWNWRVNICRKKQPRVSAIYHQVKVHLSYELNNLDKVVHGSFSRHDTTGTTRKEHICDTSQPANESKHRP